MESVTVPRVGHAPTLDEPEAIAAIDRLLERMRRGGNGPRRIRLNAQDASEAADLVARRGRAWSSR